MKAVSGTPLEAELMNTQMQQLGGVEGMTLSDGVLDMVSPLRGGNPAFQMEIKRLKQNALGERGMCELEMADTPVSIVGLSKILEQKFGAFNAADDKATQFARAKKMADYIMKWAHKSIMAHEMGHSIGHRHNFVSSSDAWNYRPQYWALRSNGNTLETAYDTLCADLAETGEECVGPRFFDPVTQNETDNLIWMWANSSVMEYPGETTQDFLGVASWDFAATRMFYGDSAPVYPYEYTNGGYPDATTTQNGYAPVRRGMVYDKLDNFGGIIGFSYSNPSTGASGNYTMLNNALNLIPKCDTLADPTIYKPSRWDDAVDGTWSPLLDGLIVTVNGNYTRCRQQPVDYVQWSKLGVPDPAEQTGYMRSLSGDGTVGYVVDQFNRVRVPYGFASDNWADIGNASVYRHDNGADTYEIFNFLASQQELFQIFDNYRRGRSTFTLSGATSRIMERYLAKMRDGAKGLAMQKNFLSLLATESAISGDSLWKYASVNWYPENLISSAFVFDHMVRNAQRPAPVRHGLPFATKLPGYENTLYPMDGDTSRCMDIFGLWEQNAATLVNCEPVGTIPNGAYATEGAGNGFTQLSAGAKVVENQLTDNQGDYDSGFTKTAGSYYDKIWMAMMMTESVDNFISESRGDFIDKRYRSVSLADLFPDGYRRWMGNMLTNDEALKGAHIAVDAEGKPAGYDVGATADPGAVNGSLQDGLWSSPLGWTKWWGDEVQACFPAAGTNICQAYNYANGWSIDLGEAPAQVKAIDSEFAWEVQKFLITWTYIYLPENQSYWWRAQMRMTQTPTLTSDMDLDGRILFYNPNGDIYIANRYGREDVLGKTVEKGISARVLQYANELLEKAYVTTPVDYDGDGTTDWYEPVVNADGGYDVRFDDSMHPFNSSLTPTHPAGCSSPTDQAECTCDLNGACMEIETYMSVIDWLAAWSGVGDFSTDGTGDMTGIW
jgi:hypothetical protein